ncbi:hypothetical protein L484_020074 [Morus notabilis]|uniref:DUF7086 domain-containing protein n=1 Tax=Morus notabilis TaxID=981085 RepID=W9RLN1_9ROSA|nr:uncharacterized protein LOC21402986 [Morus notabilis]EXB80820.1 hypothetical protein L484_020074 [Morus notabilis]
MMNETDHKMMRIDWELMEDDDDFLALKLSPPSCRLRPPPPQPQYPSMQGLLLSQTPQLQQNYQYQLQPSQNPNLAPWLPPVHCLAPPARQSTRLTRTRRNQPQGRRPGKSETVPVLFPGAPPRRATVHSLDYLLSRNIVTNTGEMQCKQCDRRFEIVYNLPEEFQKLWKFIADKKAGMSDRAPEEWENPEFPDCKYCEEKGCVKPVVAEKKREINWLFLLLGRFLKCLTLEQLKYFCKHSRNHRTGAKNRVLYLTYLGLCKQLDPSGPFNALHLF